MSCLVPQMSLLSLRSALSLILVFMAVSQPLQAEPGKRVQARNYGTNVSRRITRGHRPGASSVAPDTHGTAGQTDSIRRIPLKPDLTEPPKQTREEMASRVAAISNRLVRIDVELDDLRSKEVTDRKDMAANQRLVMEIMKGELQSDDEEIAKLRERLAKLNEELSEVRQALRERMEADPQVKEAMQKREQFHERTKTFTEKRKVLFLEKRKLALEQENLERSMKQVPATDDASDAATVNNP